jgi:hypothetical protein
MCSIILNEKNEQINSFLFFYQIKNLREKNDIFFEKDISKKIRNYTRNYCQWSLNYSCSKKNN